jgi:hypothetical protein
MVGIPYPNNSDWNVAKILQMCDKHKCELPISPIPPIASLALSRVPILENETKIYPVA